MSNPILTKYWTESHSTQLHLIHTWFKSGYCKQPETDPTRTPPEPNPYRPEHGTCKWPELELHQNRTEPDPNMVNPKATQTQTRTRPESEPDQNIVDLKVTRTELRPNLYPT